MKRLRTWAWSSPKTTCDALTSRSWGSAYWKQKMARRHTHATVRMIANLLPLQLVPIDPEQEPQKPMVH